ncbi:MAG: hypothetical protein RR382_00335 [Tannerellaceae bacterium]
MSIVDVAGIKLPEPLEDVEPAPVDSSNPYEAWKANDSPETLRAVVHSLKPTIGSVLASMGSSGDPVMTSRARVMAANAVKTYDPAHGVALPTWVSNQLRPLSRVKRQTNSIIKIPEGVQLNAYAIYRFEQEYIDKHGQEPDLNAISDGTGLTVRSITKARNSQRASVGETSFDNENGNALVGSEPDYIEEATSYVYKDTDKIGKAILENTTGYGGKPILSSQEIMNKLNLTPVQLTRARTKLALRINGLIDTMKGVY